MTHHDGHGYDASRERRPGVPMETEPQPDPDASWRRPALQRVREEHLTRDGLDELTPTFGNARTPRLASGAMRRAAYRLPEHEAKRWLLLMAADRVDVMEHRIPELFSRRSIDALERQVRANPWGMVAAAVGAGYLLQRTRVLPAVLGGVLSAVMSRESDGDGDDVERSVEEERLLMWLNDAYALEKALMPILENHAKDASRHPHVRKRDLEHLAETKRHAKLVKECIAELGEKPSAGRKAIGRLAGAINSVNTEPFQDEMVRNFLADYAAEHLEIASYRALVVTAHEAGYPEIAKKCREILKDEQKMAEWIEDNLPDAVRATLAELAVEA
jgi:ferritin-like metal-binding protein YciE